MMRNIRIEKSVQCVSGYHFAPLPDQRSWSRQNAITKDTQKGAVLVTALVMLSVLSILGLSAMGTNIMEERMAASIQDIQETFQAAESALAQALSNNDAINLSNTRDNTYEQSIRQKLGEYNGERKYEVFYRQSTPPSRNSLWDTNYSFYHFEAKGSASRDVRSAEVTLRAGLYQVGKAE